MDIHFTKEGHLELTLYKHEFKRVEYNNENISPNLKLIVKLRDIPKKDIESLESALGVDLIDRAVISGEFKEVTGVDPDKVGVSDE